MKPDPALIAEIEAQATSRHAHHEAGHAVAAVLRGGELIEVHLGTTDWSTDDISADVPGGTRHRYTPDAAKPFVTFAGPWAEAMWMVEHEDDVDDLSEALEYAWENNGDGDGARYDARVEELEEAAADLGFCAVGRAWEGYWESELEPLWPVICQVAALLIDGREVTHQVVQSLLDAARAGGDADGEPE